MISQFPEFSSLNLHHADEVKKITARFDAYSDFNFTCLYAWNTDDSAQLSILNNNLIIKLPDYMTGQENVSMIGTHQIDESLDKLLSTTTELQLIPEVILKNIKNPERFNIQEDRDEFDYIYDLDEIANLPGGKFKKKRNKANSVLKALSDRLTAKCVDKIDDQLRHNLEEVFAGWAEQSSQSHEERRSEQIAFHRLLDVSESFDLTISCLYLDGKLIAFSINEILGNQYSICHFEKTLPLHNNIATLMAVQASKALLAKGCKYANWESDVGLPGLRKAKLAFYPTKYLKKYQISAS